MCIYIYICVCVRARACIYIYMKAHHIYMSHIYVYVYIGRERERERSKYFLGRYLGYDLGGYFSRSVWIYIVVYIHNTYTDHNMKTHICSSLVLQQGMGNSLENLFANPAAVAESR